MKTCPYSASSAHSPAPSTLPHPASNHRARIDGKASALHNATPTSACKSNRANTAEPRTHNRPPDPTPRRDQLTQQAVPSRQHAPGTDGPHHAPSTTQIHHITTNAMTAQGRNNN
ncbi:hypothetical protein AMECASPLE_014189 [Ameca splendens]|uniref:Uncharacterized protein n=1 Tax=Ameca splendens TaxID=208324 RepID=A0ABV1A8N2_9TELE